jgi:hypothetical protein
MFGRPRRDRLIHELISLSQAQALRDGEFSLALSEGERTRFSITLRLHSPERTALPPPEAAPPPKIPAVRAYQTTAYFLRQCYQYLFPENPSHERQLIISGPSFPQDDRHLLDIQVAVKLANASRTGVEADIADLFRHLTALDEGHGLLLLGIFHSHLWTGRSAVTPSDTDRRLQQTLEESGYKTVQAVFSEDAYIGFFTNHVPFALNVLGTGYEEVERHATQTIIRLTTASHLSDQAVQTPQPAGASLRRSADAYPRV